MDGGSDPFGLIGQVLDGQFRVDKYVGEGGFSVVYKGHHLGLAAPIAIKCLKLPAQVNASMVESFMHRFRDESRLYYQLSQGNLSIVRSISSGTAAGPHTGSTIPYMILEWLEGRSLGQDFEERRIRKFTGRTLEEAFELFTGAAEGIGYAHAQGVVHRDMNPGNIFIVEDPRDGVRAKKTKVLDFGVAKILRDHTLELGARAQTLGAIRIFAPAYGAPEQFDDRVGEVGPWTDVYGFSLMLVEALRDKTVMEGEHIGDYARQALDPDTRPTPRTLGLTVPDEIEQVFARSFKISPKERWQNAADFWIVFRNAIRMAKHKGFAPTETVPLSTGFLKKELEKKQSERKLEQRPDQRDSREQSSGVVVSPSGGFPAAPPVGSAPRIPVVPPQAAAPANPRNESSLASTVAMSAMPAMGAMAAMMAPTPAAPPVEPLAGAVGGGGGGPDTRKISAENPASAANANTLPAPKLNATLAMGYRPSALPVPKPALGAAPQQAPAAGLPPQQQSPQQQAPQQQAQGLPQALSTMPMGSPIQQQPPQQQQQQPQHMQQPPSGPALGDDGTARPSYGTTMQIANGGSSKLPIILGAVVGFFLLTGVVGFLAFRHSRAVKGTSEVASASALLSAMASASAFPVDIPSSIPDVTAPSAAASTSASGTASPSASGSAAPDTTASAEPTATATSTATSAPTATATSATTATATSATTATATATATAAPHPTATADPNAFNEKAARGKLDTYGGIVGGGCHDPAGISGPGVAHVTFGNDGKVSGITVDAPYAGTKAGTCVMNLLKRASAPAFQGAAPTLSYKFSVDK